MIGTGIRVGQKKRGGLGPNVIVNSTFDTDTWWNKGDGCTIAGGKGVMTAATGVFSSPASTVEIGKTYKITFTVSDITLGSCKIRCGFTWGTARAVNGTYTEILLCAGNTVFYVSGIAPANTLKVDDLIVQEVL